MVPSRSSRRHRAVRSPRRGEIMRRSARTRSQWEHVPKNTITITAPASHLTRRNNVVIVSPCDILGASRSGNRPERSDPESPRPSTLRLARDHPLGADEMLAARKHTPFGLEWEIQALLRPWSAKAHKRLGGCSFLCSTRLRNRSTRQRRRRNDIATCNLAGTGTPSRRAGMNCHRRRQFVAES